MRSLIREGLDALGLRWGDLQVSQLEAYYRELELWNPRYRLVGAAGEEIIRKHIFDALCPLPLLLERRPPLFGSGRAADLGSGNGIPGIPAAVMIDELHIALIERSAKRCGFLRNCAAVTGLQQRIEVVESDMAAVSRQFPCIMLRAVKQLPDLLHILLPRLEPGGTVIAYRGTEDMTSRETHMISGYFSAHGLQEPRTEVIRAVNPLLPGHQRHVLILTVARQHDSG